MVPPLSQRAARKTITALAALAVLFADAVEAQTLSGWKAWPSKGSAELSAGHDGLYFQPEKASAIYRHFTVEPNSAHLLRLVFRPDPATEDSILRVVLVYRNRQNQPVGKEGFEVPADGASESWRNFERILIPPESAVSCQLTLTPSGSGLRLAEAGLSREKSYPVVESATPPPDKPAPEDPFWKDRPALEGFWTQEAKAARIPATVKLGRDAENLYVLFINPESNLGSLQREVTERDGAVWKNDCNELLLANSHGEIRQFIADVNAVQWDGRLARKMDGDPLQSDASWNGRWTCVAKEEDGRWISQWKIPFADLDDRPAPGVAWQINFTRHRHTGGAVEVSRWNYFDGPSNSVDRFASLRFSSDDARITRYVEPLESAPLRIERPVREYESLLEGKTESVIVTDWWHDFYRSNYPKSTDLPQKGWREQQVALLEERGRIGALGPPLPMSERSAGWETLEAAYEKFGMRFPYYLTTSANDVAALDRGARYHTGHSFGSAKAKVVEFDPAKKQSLLETVEDYLSRNAEHVSRIALFDVVDEPTNTMFKAFSRTERPDAGKILDEVDTEIRSTFGNGRFGLYDRRKPPTGDTPYERIAFVHWWNARMDEWGREVYGFLRAKAPEIPVAISTHNTVGAMPYVDFPQLSLATDWVSADPYPTAALALYGRPRALYHTGFVTKWIHDLSGGKRTRIMPQGFVYHGRGPSPDDVREWASQALKNGATVLHWYALGPARVSLPTTWEEILKINFQAQEQGAPVLPTETHTAIFHSFTSQAGLGDQALHPYYTLYALLGERLGSWFRFVGDTQLPNRGGDLSAFRLIYVPEAAYLTREAAEMLAAQAERGATVVFLDPLSFGNAADASSLADLRGSVLGGRLGAPREAARLHLLPNALPEVSRTESLPLTPQAAGQSKGSVLAFDIELPADATVFATYEDGKPAAYSRPLGKGRILYFGAHPFGNSDLATGNPAWETFLRALAGGVGEKTGLPIWNFYLKRSE